MKTFSPFLRSGLSSGVSQASQSYVVGEARELLPTLNGPTSLKRALEDLVRPGFAARAPALAALTREINRVQHALTASTSHPNRAGAARYAANALERYRRFSQVQDAMRRQALHPNTETVGESIEQLLVRCRLRGRGALIADAGHLDVDSIAVRVETDAASDENLLPDVGLVVTTKNANGKTASSLLTC